MMHWKKWFIASLLAMVLLLSCAFAEGSGLVDLTDTSRVELEQVEGLALSMEYADGIWQFELDADSTDWDKVAENEWCIDENGNVGILLNVYAGDENAVSYSRYIVRKDDYSISDAEWDYFLYNGCQNAEVIENNVYYMRLNAGVYDAVTGGFTKEEDGFSYAIQWYDAQGNVLATEKMDTAVEVIGGEGGGEGGGSVESGEVYDMPRDNATPETFDGLELMTGEGWFEGEEGQEWGETTEGFGVIHEDGYIKIVIDTEKTDWKTAIGCSMDPEDGYLYWGPYISAGNFTYDDEWNVTGYEGPVFGQACGSGVISDSQVPSLFEEDWVPTAEELAYFKQDMMEYEYYPTVEHNIEIGRYYANSATLVPMPVEDYCIYVRWFNEDGSCYYERLQLEVGFTNTDPIELEEPVANYPAEDICAGYGLTAGQKAAVSTTVSDGNLRYHVDTGVFNSDESDINIDTYVLCPDESVSSNDYYEWTCTVYRWGSPEWIELETITVNGVQRLAANIGSINTRDAREDGSPRSLYICWRQNEWISDPSGMGGEYVESIKADGMLMISALEKGTESRVSMVEGSRVSLGELDGLVAELIPSKNQWKIEIDEEQTDWDKVAANGEFTEEGQLILQIEVAAPAGATYSAGFGTSENDDEWIIHQMGQEGRNEGNVFTGGCEVGIIVDGVFERNDFSNQLLCVQWSDANGNIVLTEKMIYGTVWGSFDDEGEGGGGGYGEVELPIIDPNDPNVSVINMDDSSDRKDRVGTIWSDGMDVSMKYDAAKGLWVVYINNETTDWDKVFKSMYDAENNVVSQRFLLIGPENAVYSRGICTSVTDDRELLEMFTWDIMGRNETVVTNMDPLGSYVEGVNMFQPTVNPNRVFVMAAQWFDADKNLISIEKFMYQIHFVDSEGNENTDPTTVKLNYIPAEQIVAYGDYYEDYEHCLTATKDYGYIRYTVDTEQAAGEGLDLMTWVLCPVYMDEDESNDDPDMGNWFCERFDGDTHECELEWLDYGEDGRYLAARVYENWVDTDEDRVDTYSWILNWYTYDENGEPVEVQNGCMRHYVQVGDAEPWPTYSEDWEAVPAANIAGITAVNEIDGLTATYTDGILHIGLEEDKLPSGADLSAAHFTVQVTPPEGAVYYRENRSGGNNIFGDDEWARQDQEDIIQYRPLCTVATQPYTLEVHPSDKFTSQISEDLTLTIYLSREGTPEYGGDVNLIYWYDAAGNVISKQWIVERYDTIMRVRESGSYNDESEITGVLELPAIVVFEKGGRTNKYNLRITSYPQEGTDYIYYDLTLVDKYGNVVELEDINKQDDKRCKIYIPYPDDMNRFSNVKYNIHHLNSKHYAKEYYSEDNELFKVYRTEYGLCIEVNSLSPFVLSWSEGESLPAIEMTLPATLERIGEQAFMNGIFKVIKIADSCSYIGAQAFTGVENLTAYMPNNQELTIDANAFDWDSVTLILNADSAENIISQVPGDCRIIVQ